jgi:hypothetical protein
MSGIRITFGVNVIRGQITIDHGSGLMVLPVGTPASDETFVRALGSYPGQLDLSSREAREWIEFNTWYWPIRPKLAGVRQIRRLKCRILSIRSLGAERQARFTDGGSPAVIFAAIHA